MKNRIYYVHKTFKNAFSCENLQSLLNDGVESITISQVLPKCVKETKTYAIKDIPFNQDFDTIIVPRLKDYHLAILINSVGFSYVSREDQEDIKDLLFKELEQINRLQYRGVYLDD